MIIHIGGLAIESDDMDKLNRFVEEVKKRKESEKLARHIEKHGWAD
jgi:hypothetical protein